MSVPRGTYSPRVTRLSLARFERQALNLGGSFTELRLPVDRTNSRVTPGSFEGLDLNSGRARRFSNLAELRARCVFESGLERAVTVLPLMAVGDLFWVREPANQARTASKWTLEVTGVDVRRLQDMGDREAYAAGAAHIPKGWRLHPFIARASFAVAWNFKWSGTLAPAKRWAANPWVWVFTIKAHEANVDRLLVAMRARA